MYIKKHNPCWVVRGHTVDYRQDKPLRMRGFSSINKPEDEEIGLSRVSVPDPCGSVCCPRGRPGTTFVSGYHGDAPSWLRPPSSFPEGKLQRLSASTRWASGAEGRSVSVSAVVLFPAVLDVGSLILICAVFTGFMPPGVAQTTVGTGHPSPACMSALSKCLGTHERLVLLI